MFKEEVWALEPERIEAFFLHHREGSYHCGWLPVP